MRHRKTREWMITSMKPCHRNSRVARANMLIRMRESLCVRLDMHMDDHRLHARINARHHYAITN